MQTVCIHGSSCTAGWYATRRGWLDAVLFFVMSTFISYYLLPRLEDSLPVVHEFRLVTFPNNNNNNNNNKQERQEDRAR
jgi:hypothetical protein